VRAAALLLPALLAAGGTCGAVSAAAAAAAGPAPAAPASREDQIVTLGNPSGSQTVATDAGGVTRAEYSYNDRGRGDHIVATWKLDAAGVLTEYSGSGNDYMKAPVTETFHLTAGKAAWQNRAEHGEKAVSGEAFYMPVNAPPEMLGVLARALLKAPCSAPRLPGESRRAVSYAASAAAGFPIWASISPSCSRAGTTGPGVTGSFSTASSSSAARFIRASASSVLWAARAIHEPASSAWTWT